MEKNENFILGDKIISNFNIEKSKIRLHNLIDYYFIYELEYHYINPPMITPSYEIRYDFSKEFNQGSKTERYIINKITQEEQLKAFYDDLFVIYKKLTKEELKYFNLYFLKKKPEYLIIEHMGYNKRMFDKIKKSCIVKLTLYFNIAVRN